MIVVRLYQIHETIVGAILFLVLEQPMVHVGATAVAHLLAQVRSARDRGAGVVWITGERRIFARAEIDPSLRLRMVGARLEPAKEAL